MGYILFLIFGSLTAFSPNYWAFLTFRLLTSAALTLQGIGTGIASKDKWFCNTVDKFEGRHPRHLLLLHEILHPLLNACVLVIKINVHIVYIWSVRSYRGYLENHIFCDRRYWLDHGLWSFGCRCVLWKTMEIFTNVHHSSLRAHIHNLPLVSMLLDKG